MKEKIKYVYRFIKYKSYRDKYFREPDIKAIQKKNFMTEFNSDVDKAIIFLVPGADGKTGKETMSGGVISILSIAQETKNIFEKKQNVAVLVCTHSEDFLLAKYQNIENNLNIYSFSQVAKNFKKLKEIIIHVADYAVEHFVKHQPPLEREFLSQIQKVHFNIMNQNIKLMPDREVVNTLCKMYNLVTITTAHQQYSTQFYRDYYNVPLHKLSVWISPEQYKFVNKKDKKNLLVYSPDNHPQKQEVLNEISKIKGLHIQEIKGLTYTEFKDLISRAKWSLTFGEGLDGYFIEPIFSGTVAFAVYNQEFFTESFNGLKTVYSSYESMCSKIIGDIQELDNNDEVYTGYQKKQFDLCAELYSSNTYRNNIEKFYNNEFTFR